MSRVYEALRQSELDNGTAATVLDPTTFLARSMSTSAQPDKPETKLSLLDWDTIATVVPHPQEQSRLVALDGDTTLGAEKFRLLRARLRNIRERSRIQRVVTTSAVPDEGKTLISINLAISLAKHASGKVLLLEGDLRRPMLAEYLGVNHLKGLSDWFGSNKPVSTFMYRLDGIQLWILPAGAPRDNPLNLLQSDRFLDFYKQLSQSFDWIFIDAPPLLPMADVSFWSRQSDGLLIVVREGHTPKKALQKGLESLDDPTILGVVLNEASAMETSYYHHYYGKEDGNKTRTA